MNPNPVKGTLSSLIKQKALTLFLVDISGVLHHDDGVVAGAVNTMAYLQQIGQVFLVTNNSCQDPSSISNWLNSLGFSIAPDHIISSGLGLSLDPDIHTYLNQKRVYIYGQESSYSYVDNATYHSIVTDYSQAECIVMTSSHKEASEEKYLELKRFLQTHRCPVVCCNPDQFVRGKKGAWIPVVGSYAKRLEIETGCLVKWVGKPYENFSGVVKKYLLEQFSIKLDKHACFFDDNPYNVKQLSQDLQIHGCCVTQTGILPLILQSDSEALNEVIIKVSSFSLDSQVIF